MRIFKEEQKFAQPWILILVGTSVLIPLGLVLKEYTTEGSNVRAVEILTVVATTFAAFIPLLFFKLKTRIDEKGIHYTFFPFKPKMKTILWVEIKSVEVRKYKAVSEYGGWGYKGFINRRKGRAISVRGNTGIQLELKNNKKLLIGTQKETEAKKVLDTYMHKITGHEN